MDTRDVQVSVHHDLRVVLDVPPCGLGSAAPQTELGVTQDLHGFTV